MKKTKSTTEKRIMKSKLKQYSALAASVVALDASAQVAYTNIKDTTLVNNGDYFDIDLNNDGIREGRIEFVNYLYSSTLYTSSSINIQAAEVDSLVNASVNIINSTTSSTSSTYVAAALNLNTQINNNLNSWSNGPIATTTGYGSALNGVLIGGKAIAVSSSGTSTNSVGQFPGSGDRYLGVKFTIGTSTHYGWLRLDMSINSDSITIKDFAYEATPDKTILAGDTGTLVGLTHKNLKNQFDYFASNRKIIINSELTSNSILSIYDLGGKLLQSETIGLKKEVSALENLEGIYIVEIRNSTGVTRKKLWLGNN